MKAVVMDLLRQYLKVETQFQHGESLSALRIYFLKEHFWSRKVRMSLQERLL